MENPEDPLDKEIDFSDGIRGTRRQHHEILKELKEEIVSLLHQWSPSRDRSDYQCAFCGENPSTNIVGINHLDTCVGRKWEKILWGL